MHDAVVTEPIADSGVSCLIVHYMTRIADIYALHNPSQLDEIPQLDNKYFSKEEK